MNPETTSSDNSSGECAQQIKRFEKITGTNRDEWETAELKSNTKSVDAQGREYYEFSNKDTEDYKEITPHFDYLKETDPKRLENLIAEHEENRSNDDKSPGSWWYSCQYCGHGIVYEFKIKNVKRKFVMTIGSHCIKGFQNVDPFLELIRKRNEETLKTAMKKWSKKTCIQIWTDQRLAKHIYKKEGKIKMIPKKKFLDFYELIKDLDVDSCSFAELKRIFRKVDKLEFIEFPPDVEDIIHPKLAKQKKKQGGLDELFKN